LPIGGRQVAILAAPARATSVASFDVIAGSRRELRYLLRTLRERVVELRHSGARGRAMSRARCHGIARSPPPESQSPQ
jgi:hypothetical protein